MDAGTMLLNRKYAERTFEDSHQINKRISIEIVVTDEILLEIGDDGKIKFQEKLQIN